jgi:hypothetical protein
VPRQYLPVDKLADSITVIDPCRSKTMKLTLKHAIAAIILMLRAGPLEDADAAIKRRDYATAVAATFIGLAVVAPERVDRTVMDILNKL